MSAAGRRKKVLFKRLVVSLLGDFTSGMLFSVGYIMVDHIHDSIDPTAPSEVSFQKNVQHNSMFDNIALLKSEVVSKL